LSASSEASVTVAMVDKKGLILRKPHSDLTGSEAAGSKPEPKNKRECGSFTDSLEKTALLRKP
ncbi:MAG: hypothetical protein P8182_17885, partial [Deltaproteobacteria bacterium]